MNCGAFERLILQSGDHLLSPAQENRLHSHLEGCPACRNFQGAVRSNRNAIEGAMFAPSADGLESRIFARIQADRSKPETGRRTALQIAAAAAFGMSAVVLIKAYLPHESQTNPHRTNVASTRPAPKSSSVKPVENTVAAGDVTPVGPPPVQKDRSFDSNPKAASNPKVALTPIVNPPDDLDYLNRDSVATLAAWNETRTGSISGLQAEIDRSVHSTDDFVRIEFPKIAGIGKVGIKAAVEEYRKQKETTDSRLARKITLAVKGMSLEDVCKLLAQQAQIEIKVTRSLADEKVTIFCEDLPARDIMRGINRVFGFDWARVGQENAWRYELDQDLRSRLLEEELRSRDTNAALLSLDTKMRQKAEKSRISLHSDPMAEIYGNLSAGDRAALRNGQSLVFSSKDGGDNPITQDLKMTHLKVIGQFRVKPDGSPTNDPGEGQFLYERSDVVMDAGFRLAQTELGELTLQGSSCPRWTMQDGTPTSLGNATGFGNPMLTVRSPLAEQPDNATANKGLKHNPAMQQMIAISTASSCPNYRTDPLSERIQSRRMPATNEGQLEIDRPVPLPHAMSGDAWEAIHKATGKPVIADYYSRLYPLDELQAAKQPLFDALCKVADRIGARWSYEPESKCILGKTLSWFWDKRKEIPNRLLARWEDEKRRNGGLALRSVIEIANLPDAQLDSITVLQTMRHCRGISELELAGANSGGWRDFFIMRRQVLRALSPASETALHQLTSPEGAPFSAMHASVRANLVKALEPMFGDTSRLNSANIRIDYVPSGEFAWYPQGTYMHSEEDSKGPITHGKTEEEALAAARKRYPDATASAIHPSGGLLGITVITRSPTEPGKNYYWSFGKPIPGIE